MHSLQVSGVVEPTARIGGPWVFERVPGGLVHDDDLTVEHHVVVAFYQAQPGSGGVIEQLRLIRGEGMTGEFGGFGQALFGQGRGAAYLAGDAAEVLHGQPAVQMVGEELVPFPHLKGDMIGRQPALPFADVVPAGLVIGENLVELVHQHVEDRAVAFVLLAEQQAFALQVVERPVLGGAHIDRRLPGDHRRRRIVVVHPVDPDAQPPQDRAELLERGLGQVIMRGEVMHRRGIAPGQDTRRAHESQGLAFPSLLVHDSAGLQRVDRLHLRPPRRQAAYTRPAPAHRLIHRGELFFRRAVGIQLPQRGVFHHRQPLARRERRAVPVDDVVEEPGLFMGVVRAGQPRLDPLRLHRGSHLDPAAPAIRHERARLREHTDLVLPGPPEPAAVGEPPERGDLPVGDRHPVLKDRLVFPPQHHVRQTVTGLQQHRLVVLLHLQTTRRRQLAIKTTHKGLTPGRHRMPQLARRAEQRPRPRRQLSHPRLPIRTRPELKLGSARRHRPAVTARPMPPPGEWLMRPFRSH